MPSYSSTQARRGEIMTYVFDLRSRYRGQRGKRGTRIYSTNSLTEQVQSPRGLWRLYTGEGVYRPCPAYNTQSLRPPTTKRKTRPARRRIWHQTSNSLAATAGKIRHAALVHETPYPLGSTLTRASDTYARRRKRSGNCTIHYVYRTRVCVLFAPSGLDEETNHGFLLLKRPSLSSAIKRSVDIAATIFLEVEDVSNEPRRNILLFFFCFDMIFLLFLQNQCGSRQLAMSSL